MIVLQLDAEGEAMMRIAAILASLLMLSSCSDEPTVEQQLRDSGYILERDMPPNAEEAFHIQVWKSSDVEIVVSNVLNTSRMEIISIAESESATEDSVIFSCAPIQREQVSPSVDSFQIARKIFAEGKAVATPMVEGSSILKVQLPSPHECHLIPKG